MSRAPSARKYGKQSKRVEAKRLFAEIPQSPIRPAGVTEPDDALGCITGKLSVLEIRDVEPPQKSLDAAEHQRHAVKEDEPVVDREATEASPTNSDEVKVAADESESTPQASMEDGVLPGDTSLRILTWDDVCPPCDRIEKIAEASYAEVYRITNERGTSIIKAIRLESPIKPQTKTQIAARLVDEEPRCENEVKGELQISEWLADIPGFVVYKECYVVQGKATRGLLETHQKFQRKLKRQDPGRAQFYPSPSRYLADTKFLVVELGDAGKPLEDWKLLREAELWDIFFLEAIALARAEDIAMFEHRDLHEGNLCVRRVADPIQNGLPNDHCFGYSGLDITILDYGLSRAEDLSVDFAKPVACDLEKDMSIFSSTHAPQCKVYRRMRSFLLRADRVCLPPEAHDTPYAEGVHGKISWEAYAPYTNVLWLAYLFEYLVSNFAGQKQDLTSFKTKTREMWKYLNPEAKRTIPCFGSAADVVCFAVEAGWIKEEQLMEGASSFLEREDSIIISRDDHEVDSSVRRSPRRQQ